MFAFIGGLLAAESREIRHTRSVTVTTATLLAATLKSFVKATEDCA
jgi:hypothetical protein